MITASTKLGVTPPELRVATRPINYIASLLGLLGLGLVVSSAANAAIVEPVGLNLGDTYHLVFVTSSKTDANSGDIDDYNDFVQAAADAAGVGFSEGVDWFAIGSTGGTGTVHARDNAVVGATSPVFLMDGVTKVADGFGDIWDGTLDNGIDQDHAGDTIPDFTFVWTGTADNGFADSGNELGGAGTDARRGFAGFTNGGWVSTNSHLPQTDLFSMYALSEELTVGQFNAVPEPSTLALGIVGLLSLGMIGRRRRNR